MRVGVLVLVVTLLAVGHSTVAAAAAGQQALTEAQAKAGFLYNCAMFVTWPEGALKGAEIVIGVVGDDAVSTMVKGMHGQTVNGLRIRVAAVGARDDLAQFHILFVAGDARSAREVLDRIGDAPVLTVGEYGGFARNGGMVRLYTEQSRLRFEINMTRAEGAGLRVSAKMLGLARIVR